MSGLSKYNGNFIQYLDDEVQRINSEHNYRFPEQIDALDISVYCKVAVLPSSGGETIVQVDTDDIGDFKVHCDRGRLCISQEGDDFFCQTSSGGTVITNVRGNMSIINGQVFVNGVPIEQKQTGKRKRPSQIVIYCPQGVNLDAELSGDATLASKVVFNKSSIKVSGQGTIGIASKSLKMKLSGQGNSFIVMRGGDLDITLSGQGDLKVKGEWSEADVSISGMGSVRTDGNCLGNYSARVSGMGSIEHKGNIRGRIRESVSGMGKCYLQ